MRQDFQLLILCTSWSGFIVSIAAIWKSSRPSTTPMPIPTRKYTIRLMLYDGELMEYICPENNRDIPHLVGK